MRSEKLEGDESVRAVVGFVVLGLVAAELLTLVEDLLDPAEERSFRLHGR